MDIKPFSELSEKYVHVIFFLEYYEPTSIDTDLLKCI